MSDEPATAFPLYWPTGRPRARTRERSRFKVTSFTRVRDELLHQLDLMGAKKVILSTNIELRRDGLPMAGQRAPRDPGVAVYFEYKGRTVAFACDRWDKIDDNLQAVRHTIDALRGIARWGTGDMVDAAFRGFTALPAHVPPEPWRSVFHLNGEPVTFGQVEAAYRLLAMAAHPDRGGSDERMARLNDALDRARAELK
jgi:hypothetical protein